MGRAKPYLLGAAAAALLLVLVWAVGSGQRAAHRGGASMPAGRSTAAPATNAGSASAQAAGAPAAARTGGAGERPGAQPPTTQFSQVALLLGKSREEVVRLLGNPDDTMGGGLGMEQDWTYKAKPDNSVIVVSFLGEAFQRTTDKQHVWSARTHWRNTGSPRPRAEDVLPAVLLSRKPSGLYCEDTEGTVSTATGEPGSRDNLGVLWRDGDKEYVLVVTSNSPSQPVVRWDRKFCRRSLKTSQYRSLENQPS